ncbi:MAG: molybdopterin molybdotransferase MoeA [Pseudomonadales bacterium]|nr:molybdopterin molybdotransferase MoeA [Pseudomonadales bacterium]
MNTPTSQLTPVDDALKYLLKQVSCTQKIEYISLSDATGRVLAKDQVSTIDVPPWDNSAMDGYAVCFSDLQKQPSFRISQRIPAGTVGAALEPGTAARIFTGAPVPTGADAVIMQEQCSIEAGRVSFLVLDQAEKDQNIRVRGDDLSIGQVVLLAGVRLGASELGLLASVGIDKVPVYRKLKVAMLSTGDELVEPGREVGLGKIYNSNRYSLTALIRALNMEPLPFGIVEDSRQATEKAFRQAASQADLIISSGGVSVGEEDHVKAVIEQSGFLHLWKLAIKPGKPFAYGEFSDTPILALPGNPSAVLITFLILAKPYMLKMQGMTQTSINPAIAEADFDLPRKSIRRRYLYARLDCTAPDTTLELPKVQIYPNQSSGILSGASWAEGVAEVEVDQVIAKGDRIKFFSFQSLLG